MSLLAKIGVCWSLLDEVPEMQRGKGVILQRGDGDLSDIKVFTLADGLSWQMGGADPYRIRFAGLAGQARGNR